MKKQQSKAKSSSTSLGSKWPNKLDFSKKDFLESPLIEQFYKTLYENQLRESAYKTAIEVYLSRKS